MLSYLQIVKLNACLSFWTLRNMLIPQRCVKHLLHLNTALQCKTNLMGDIHYYANTIVNNYSTWNSSSNSSIPIQLPLCKICILPVRRNIKTF